MQFHVITGFPEMCKAYTNASILGRAQKAGVIGVSYYDPRTYTEDKHNKTDDRPYGGGPGMVMTAQPILAAAEKALVGAKTKSASEEADRPIATKLQSRKKKVLIMSPRGKQFDQAMAKKLAKGYSDIVLIAGRYEGIDARVKKILKAEEVSVGPYTLTGGELPALSIIDAVARHIPGVLGKGESLEDTRTSAGEMYTRPDVLEWKGKNYKVPKVLQSGNHAEIDKWKAERK